MPTRIVSSELDAAADRLADRIEPIMRDAFFRVENLRIQYDEGRWQAILHSITEKLPKRLRNMPMTKDDRMELLGMIDIMDRTVREKGPRETADTLIKALVTLFDLFGGFRHELNLKILDEDGNDITEDIFGRE